MQIKKLKKSDSKGFTLIELLIVIIIIGILAAIAFVAYSGTQNKAHLAAAQSTLAEVKSKLAEYNADNGNYPATQAALDTWLASSAGGNNTNLSQTFVTTKGYTYTANAGSSSGSGTGSGTSGGGTCDNTTTQCEGFTLTANASIWSGQSNLTVTN
jgi:type IV pilus assembly protein PilE